MAKRNRLQECLISTDFPYRQDDDFNTYLRMMGDMMQRTTGLRRPGSTALDLAYVAAGFTDGFFEPARLPSNGQCFGQIPQVCRCREQSSRALGSVRNDA